MFKRSFEIYSSANKFYLQLPLNKNTSKIISNALTFEERPFLESSALKILVTICTDYSKVKNAAGLKAVDPPKLESLEKTRIVNVMFNHFLLSELQD